MFWQQFTEEAGELFISIPAALVILLSREWYCAQIAGERGSDILARFSLLSFAGLSLNGTAPGGLLRECNMPLLRFLHGQLWLLILVGIAAVYAWLKSPLPESFAARFPLAIIMQSWSLFVVNWIPLPPFDAALFYFSPYLQWRFFTALTTLLSLLSIVVFAYGFWRVPLVTGKFWGQWLKLI
ncbi:MAG: hypothetical protein N2Z22_10040 [Turneriella sp.]|nr:hypothetical protein [Leptospiraceae bacterium]MCX7633658.1 hypothetical protein [Turneriella sp.]